MTGGVTLSDTLGLWYRWWARVIEKGTRRQPLPSSSIHMLSIGPTCRQRDRGSRSGLHLPSASHWHRLIFNIGHHSRTGVTLPLATASHDQTETRNLSTKHPRSSNRQDNRSKVVHRTRYLLSIDTKGRRRWQRGQGKVTGQGLAGKGRR